MRCVCWHQLDLVAFVLDEKLFHLQHTIPLFRFGQPGVGPGRALSKKRPFGWYCDDREILQKLTVVEDDLFATFDSVLCVEAEAETLQGLLRSDNSLGLDACVPFRLAFGLDLAPTLGIHSSLERLEFNYILY